MFRTRKVTKQYKNNHDDVCPFCHPKAQNIISETLYSRVVKNLFPYNVWEFRNVTEHYMVVPKRHALSLAELSPEERIDIMNIMAEYEARNFNIYARSNNSVLRTAPHQHTHLIKTDTKHAKAAIYIAKPYIVAKI